MTTQPALLTTPLPHQTGEGPGSRSEWRKVLATAPRSTDSVGREIIQVCTASDGRGIFATVDCAEAASKSFSALRADRQTTKARGQ
jgi:hypothetical protein